MRDEEMADKHAKEYRKDLKSKFFLSEPQLDLACQGYKDGYNKANEWHKVSEKLPEMDVLIYLWNKIDDFPVVACRHIPYGQKEWVWDCKCGSGFTTSQSVGEDYLWQEIVLPKLPKEDK